MKKIKVRKKLAYGSPLNGYISNPLYGALQAQSQNAIDWDASKSMSERNPFAVGLDVLGSIAPLAMNAAVGMKNPSSSAYSGLKSPSSFPSSSDAKSMYMPFTGMDGVKERLNSYIPSPALSGYQRYRKPFAYGGTADPFEEDRAAAENIRMQEAADNGEEYVPSQSEMKDDNMYAEDENLLQGQQGEEMVEEAQEEEETPQNAVEEEVPIEVEGGEVVEEPGGEPVEMEGALHEQGGIDLNVPEGTNVYSDRIAIDGKSLSERKMTRDRRIRRLEKAVKMKPNDLVLLTSLARARDMANREDVADRSVQDSYSKMLSGGNGSSFAMGTKLGGVGRKTPSLNYDFLNKVPYGADPLNVRNYNFMTNQAVGNPFSTAYTAPNEYFKPNGYAVPSSKKATPSGEIDLSPSKKWYNNFENITPGDVVSTGGALYSSIAPLLSTMRNREGDRPNVNYMQDYGRRGQQLLDRTGDMFAQNRDDALRDLNSSRATLMNRLNNSARGVNAYRASAIAADANYNRAASNVYNSYGDRVASLQRMRAEQQNQMDRAYMGGERERDMSDRADRDNYYTNLSQAEQGVGQGVQYLGSVLNRMAERNAANRLINNTSVRGVESDIYGNMQNSERTQGTTTPDTLRNLLFSPSSFNSGNNLFSSNNNYFSPSSSNTDMNALKQQLLQAILSKQKR